MSQAGNTPDNRVWPERDRAAADHDNDGEMYSLPIPATLLMSSAIPLAPAAAESPRSICIRATLAFVPRLHSCHACIRANVTHLPHFNAE